MTLAVAGAISNKLLDYETSEITVSLIDECLTTQLNPLTISSPEFIYGVVTSDTYLLGLDSNTAADNIGTATICGGTTRVLTPVVSFMHYDSGTTDLVYNQQDETTIGTHSFTLSRSMIDYPSVTDSNTFSVTISCPNELLTSSLVTPIQSALEYDLSLRNKVEVELPTVQLTPSACFAVSTYNIVNSLGNVPNWAKVENGKLVVQMDDPSLFGSHELTLTAVVNDSVGTNLSFNGQNKITIDAIGACAATEVVPADFEDI